MEVIMWLEVGFSIWWLVGIVPTIWNDWVN